MLLLRGQITVARGDSQPAWRAVEEIQSPFSAPADTSVTLPLARLDIEARLADGDTSGALAAASAIAAQRGTADPRYLWPLLATAMRACAEASGPPELRRALQARARGLTRPGPAEGAQALTFMAEAARAAGREDLTGWDAAAAAWQALNQPYPLAYALVRAASAAARAGDKQAAAVRLRRAAVIADQLAARPLLLQISQLARRAKIAPPAAARLDPAKRPVRSPAAAALTEREREVVTLVAAGLSNAQIAERLVISPLTAKTHVSRAMTKLGARDRAQLVVLAYQAGLGRPTPT